MPMTIDHAFRWWSMECPDRDMVVSGGTRISYAQMDAWVSRVAIHFAELGLRRGDRVAICAENSIEWVVCMLAAIRAGGISAGISTRLVKAELDWLIEEYRPHIVVSDAPNLSKLAGMENIFVDCADVADLKTGSEAGADFPADPEDVVLIITTSGSTARPKGVMFSNRAICEHNLWQAVSDPLRSAYRRFIIAPLSTSAGTIPFLHTLLSGGTAYIEPTFDAAEALRIISQERLTFLAGAPIFFQRIADLPEFAEADLSCVEIAHTGGATVVEPLLRKWAAKGVILRQMFGQTESGGTGVVNSRHHALTHPDKCGGSMMFTDVAIKGPDGRFLKPGETGEIVLRGPGFMTGYWNNPEATREVLRDGWLHTGDLGYLDDLGLLKMVDRIKDIIISGGLNVSAAEVERVILEMGVEEVAVIAARDEKFGEVPMAIVHGAVPDLGDIIAHCRQNLADFKVPKYIVNSAEPLPRLTTGKISKPELRRLYGGDNPLPERLR